MKKYKLGDLRKIMFCNVLVVDDTLAMLFKGDVGALPDDLCNREVRYVSSSGNPLFPVKICISHI